MNTPFATTPRLEFCGQWLWVLCLGSALAFGRAYAQVRGFNLREAGEDFYLLNKLAKLGKSTGPQPAPITPLPSKHAYPTAPLWHRRLRQPDVPTGRFNGLPLLRARVFFTLKHWFDLAPTLSQHSLTAVLKSLPAPLQNALQAQGIGSLADHLGRQGKTRSKLDSSATPGWTVFAA